MRRISQKTKKIRKMGQGTLESYTAAISTREFSSHSARSDYPHPYLNRNVSLMSSGERDFFLHLIWSVPGVKEIQEQYPLPIEQTDSLCKEYGIRHPKDNIEGTLVPFTTDFLVIFETGKRKAYSVKYSRNDLKDARTLEKLFIEKHYWSDHDIDYELVFRNTDINRTEAMNLRLIYSRLKWSEVETKSDFILYLIAHGKIVVEGLDTKPIDLPALTAQYFPDQEKFASMFEEARREEECLNLIR